MNKSHAKTSHILLLWELDIQWRNLYGSGLLDKLAQHYDKITIVCPKRDYEYPLPANVSLVHSRWLRADPIQKRLADLNRIYFFLKFKQLNSFRREQVKTTTPYKSLLVQTLGPLTRLLFFFHLLLRAIPAALFFIRYRPTIFLSTTFIWDTFDSVLGFTSKLTGTPWATMVTSWDNPGTKGRFMVCPDYVFVWGELNKNQVMHFQSFPQERIRVLPPPQFERLRVAAQNERSKKHIAYIGGTAGNYPFERDFVHLLRKKCIELGINEKYPIVLRPHPNDLDSWFHEFSNVPGVELDPSVAKRRSGWSVFDVNAESLDQYFDLLKDAIVTISHYSTATVEAGLLGVPSIFTNINFSDPQTKLPIRSEEFDHWQKLRNSIGVLRVWNEQDLEQTLKLAIAGFESELVKEHFKNCEDVAVFPPENLLDQYVDQLVSMQRTATS